MQIDIQITPDDLKAELAESIETATEDLMAELAPLIQTAGRETLGGSPPSVKGNPPAKRSETLQGSLEAIAKGDEIHLSVIYYGGFHDEVFEDQVKSAGWTDRPFVDDAIELGVSRLPKSL
jgi:hypothetical protein